MEADLLAKILLDQARLAEQIDAMMADLADIKDLIRQGSSRSRIAENWLRLDDVIRLEELNQIGITNRRHLVNCGIQCGILREGIEYRMAASGGRGSLGYQFEVKKLINRIDWFYALPEGDRVAQFGVDRFKCFPGKQP